MGCKASITIAARKELRIPDDFQVEAMAAVADRVRKNCFLRRLQARETPERSTDTFPRAFSKGRSNLNNSGHS